MRENIKATTIDVFELFGGAVFALGRRDGERLRLEIEKAIDNGLFITINFDKIKMANHSFIDEVVGFLIRTKGKTVLQKFEIINKNQIIQHEIKDVIEASTEIIKNYKIIVKSNNDSCCI